MIQRFWSRIELSHLQIKGHFLVKIQQKAVDLGHLFLI